MEECVIVGHDVGVTEAHHELTLFFESVERLLLNRPLLSNGYSSEHLVAQNRQHLSSTRSLLPLSLENGTKGTLTDDFLGEDNQVSDDYGV